jgi:tetratricopeptide (TPR) repeat protein
MIPFWGKEKKMDRHNQIKIAVLLIAAFFAALVTAARQSDAGKTQDKTATKESPSVLLEEGMYAEQTEGDLDKAMAIYNEIIEQHQDEQTVAARATYQLGMCYLKKGDKAKAAECFRKVVSNYPNQKEIGDQAREQFSKIYPGQQIVEREVTIARPAVDPAKLMPANTLIYVELGSPGKQLETIINMLKGTPLENPFALIGGGSGGRSPGNMLGAFFNPSMLAEFKKIRGSAIGITGLAQNNPPFVGLLDPGQSDALRGLIMAALGAAGAPGEPIEGMQVLTIEGKIGIAYDDQIIIIANPLEQLRWSVRQYKGLSDEPSLASANKSFSRISREVRQDNAITIWADVDKAFAGVKNIIGEQKLPQRFRIADYFADFEGMNEFLAYLSIQPSGIAAEAEIDFKPDHQCLAYDMIRTPNIGKKSFAGAPARSGAILSFALSEESQLAGEQVQKAVKNLTGLDIGREIYANIEQVTVFVVPPASRVGTGAAAVPVLPNIGVAFTSHEPQHSRELLDRILKSVEVATGGSAGMAAPGESAVSDRYVLKFGGGKEVTCRVAQVGKTTVVGLGDDVLQAALSALKGQDSIVSTPVIGQAIAQLPDDASKVLMVNVGQQLRLADAYGAIPYDDSNETARAAVAELAKAFDGTCVEVYTSESRDRFGIHAGISGIPPVDQIYVPARQLFETIHKAGAKAKKGAKAQTSACIMKTDKAPVIDGTADEVWSQAKQYELKNVIYSPIQSPNDFAANFKALWDNENMYMLVDVTDDKLENDAAKWYLNDCIEVFIDADNSKSEKYDDNDYQYHFDWDKTNPRMDEDEHHKIQGIEFAMVTTETGYRTEIKFPWSTLGTKPAAGKVIGFEVNANDNDNGQRTKLAWYNKGDVASGSPSRWGTADLAGQIGWWKFDEGSGEVAGDSSGGGHNCTISGATWKQGGWDGKGFCLGFGGDGDTVVDNNAGTYLNGLSELTVSVWVKSDKTGTDNGIILFCDPDNINERGIRYDKKGVHGSGTNVIKCGVTVGDESPQLESSDSAQSTEWQHLVMTWSSGNRVKLYINGKVDSPTWSRTPQTGVLTGSTKLLIGKGCKYGFSSDATGWDGLIDDVRIYNYVLSDAEIQALANK